MKSSYLEFNGIFDLIIFTKNIPETECPDNSSVSFQDLLLGQSQKIRHPSSNEYELIAIRISSISISGQNPGWILNVYDKDKIEFFDTIRMVEVVVCCQVQVSDDLIPSHVACRSQVHGGQILGLNENDTVLIRDGYIDLRDTFFVLFVGGRSVPLPEFKGEVVKLSGPAYRRQTQAEASWR